MRNPRTLRALPLIAAALLGADASAQSADPIFTELAEASLSQIEGTMDVPGLRAPVEVLRDEWGIAHIYAQNEHDLFFAQGYVQAQDRLWQIDMWRRVNEGRLSEILGPEALRHDELARLITFRGDWDAEFASYHPRGRQIFQAFADGVNAWIDQIGDDLPVEYRLTGLRPLRWTPQASTGRVATALPLGDARSELRLARRVADDGALAVDRDERAGVRNWIPLGIPDGLDPSLITDEVIDALGGFRGGFPKPPLLPEYRDLPGASASLNMGAIETSPGSNNWAVSGERTATGEVLLANDPHRGVSNPSLRYLVHLDAPGYSVIGATEPAIPGVAIGHNGHVGWGLTIVGTDQADVFVETLNPANLDQARWQGEWYALEVVADTIPVRGEAPRIVEHRFSRHGPVFYVDSANHVAYAVRSTASEPGSGGYLGALRLAETEDCHQFIDALAYYNAPTENMVCGDVDGNIAWLAAALSPKRVGGWYGRLPVPGTGAYAWDGFRSHTELPQEFNPERGWVGTANHDIQPPGYYPPLMFRGSTSLRFDRLQEMMEGAENLTAADFERMQHDAQHPWFAEQDRPLLTGWTSEDPDVEWARAQLAAWDGVYRREQVAPALHNRFRRYLSGEARAAGTPAAQRRALAETALERALDNLEETFGEDRGEWRWGRIHRSEFPHWLVAAYDLAAVERNAGAGLIHATGATFREIIDFADFDHSRATSTPGQSMQPGSPF
ncbi:MAG TPA: penicillin acylase family protein, partial [Longimicrobiales bacterium]|nr:penicillin acylase family protein [Longimicrobiales bacterium]